MYSFPYLEPGYCFMSGFNSCLLFCIQIPQEAGKVIRYSHLLKKFLQFVVINAVKGLAVVNEAKVDIFLELSCFFYDPADVGDLTSSSSAFSKSSLYIWKVSVHIPLKPCLENCKYYFARVRWVQLCSTWTFFGIAFLWDWSKNWPFPVLWPLLSFPNLLAYWVQHFHSIII